MDSVSTEDVVSGFLAWQREIQQEPTEMPYGIDAEFRDPSGNRSRLVQRTI